MRDGNMHPQLVLQKPHRRQRNLRVKKTKLSERISTAYATQSPETTRRIIAPTTIEPTHPQPCRPPPTTSAPTDDTSDSDYAGSDGSDVSDGDNLNSFITKYYGEFGRKMIEDAARSSEIRDRVCQVLQQRPGLTYSVDAVERAAGI
ncbi:hypothetical protein BDV12DRAFT_204063 [Aspergillus spectabilis]